MSNFLAIDTSSKYLTVLACKGDRVVTRHFPECAMRHSVILMDEIEDVLNECRLSPEDCNFFAAVTGPGSFTGIRIGLSTVKGLCMATGAKSVGVTSFELIAYNVASVQPFGVVIDAMHGNYYFASYSPEGAQLVPPCYITAEQAESFSLPLYGFEQLPLKNYTCLNAGDCLFNAVVRAEDAGAGRLHALYVRKSQAEEARK